MLAHSFGDLEESFKIFSRGQLSEILVSTGYTGPTDVSWNRGKLINWYSTQCGGAGCNNSDNNGNLMKQEVWIPANEQVSSWTNWYQQFDYDNLNRLQRVKEHDSGATQLWQQEYVYDRWGNRTIHQTNTWGTGIPKPNFGVDAANNNRLTAPAGYTMSYDGAGNLINDTYTGQGQRTYDAENRMKQAWASGQWQTYSYDGDGRRVKRNVNGVEETWQVYGVGGELLAEYAQNGSAANPQKEYGYRNGRLLITATAATGGWGSPPVLNDNPLEINVTPVRALHVTQLRTAINALRTHLGLSNYTWVYSATTNDLISANPIMEMRTALDQALGAPSPAYAAGLVFGQPIKKDHIQELRDRVLAAWNSGAGGVDIRWLVADQLGTPRMVFDKTGSLAGIKRHDYLPFGEDIFAGTGSRTTPQGYQTSPTPNDGVRQKFTSKERDSETGLDFFEARYYSSIQGRFTSPDSPFMDQWEFTPQSWNLYSYVRNNPLRFVDPTGNAAEENCDKICQDSKKRAEEERKKAEEEGIDVVVIDMVPPAVVEVFLVSEPPLLVWRKGDHPEYEFGIPSSGGLRYATNKGPGFISRIGSWLGFGKTVQSAAARNIGGITAEQAARLRELLEKIPGAAKVRAFGSRTTGAFTKDSDLDIAILGNVDRANPNTVRAVREAQRYAESIGIGIGKGHRPLDINVYRSVEEMHKSFRSNPGFDPSRGVPKLVGIE